MDGFRPSKVLLEIEMCGINKMFVYSGIGFKATTGQKIGLFRW